MRRSWLRLFLAGVVLIGAIVGYLVSTGLGERLLHQEIETQMSRLLSGPVEIAEVELRFVGGLRVEARGLEAYPSPDPAGQPALRAGRVLAWIDLLALLVGRLELSTLILDGPHLRIEQNADGSFVGLPLPPITPGPEAGENGGVAERLARQLESLDPAAAALTERFRAADRIEILDGTLNWIDRGRLTEDGTPQEFRFELVSGVAERDWLSDAVAVEWRAVFVDGEHVPFPIEFEMHSDKSPHFEWTASFSKIPLEIAEAPLSFLESIEDLAGTLDVQIRFTTSAPGKHTLTLECAVDDAKISLRQPKSIIEQERVELRAEFALDSKSLRISEGRLNGQSLGLDFEAVIERPIRPASRVHIESRMVGVGIDGIRDLAAKYDEQFDIALTIHRLTERIESGHLHYIRAAGTARLQHWQELATGRTRDLPSGFLVGAAVDEVFIGTGSADPIEDLEGELDWVGDQISLRNMNAVYNGRPLPEMNVVIDGLSHLIRTPESARTMTGIPPPVPGWAPLLQIFKPRNPDALPPVKAIGLAIDWLEHPLLRWPVRDARVLIEPLRHGMQLNIREGTWAGAAVEGDAVWLSNSDSPTIRAHLVLGPPPTPPPDSSAGSTGAANISDISDISDVSDVSGAASKRSPSNPENDTLNADRWGSGRFELEFRPRPNLPFERAVGFFRLDGANLIGNEIEIDLVPSGQAALRAGIDLHDPERVGLDLSFAITKATFGGLSEFVVLPPKLVTGDVGATGTLIGLVRPNTSFVAELDGRVRIEAKGGLIKTSLPLLLRLGKASEGFNPFSNKDELQYESMTGTIELEHGRLSIEDFEIEGPLRVFANARLDTNRRPADIKAVVGIFLFRTSGQLLGSLPLVRSFLPGSKRGLIGAYFEVEGPVNEPRVEALPLQTLMSSVPDAIKAPFKVLRFLFGRDGKGS